MQFGIKSRLRKIGAIVLGTIIDERYWAKKYKNKESDIIKDWWSIEDRLYLLEKIKSDTFNSILEVGSSCGPNLKMIAKRFADAKLVGIDISPESIKIGNELLRKEGFNNVTLYEGKADRIDFPDKSFDLVFTFALMLFIGPDKIKKVISECLRVAKKRILLLEWHDPDLTKSKFEGHWFYNYEKLLHSFDNKIKNVQITKLPDDEFEDPNWKKYGYFIDIRSKKEKI